MAPHRILVALALSALVAATSGCCGGRAPATLASDLDAYESSPLAAPVPAAHPAPRKASSTH